MQVQVYHTDKFGYSFSEDAVLTKVVDRWFREVEPGETNKVLEGIYRAMQNDFATEGFEGTVFQPPATRSMSVGDVVVFGPTRQKVGDEWLDIPAAAYGVAVVGFEEVALALVRSRERFAIAYAEGVNPFKVGDILTASWGYDQTNIDYLEVTTVTPKSVRVRYLVQERVDGGNMTTDMVMPVPGGYRAERPSWDPDADAPDPRGPIKRVQWSDYDGTPEPYIKLYSWGTTARLWSGTARGQTNPAFGH